jgi:hypothetical protein
VEQAGKPVAKNVELLWNRPESLLLKMLSYCGTSILPAAKNVELLWNKHLACC